MNPQPTGKHEGYRAVPFSMNRRMASASATVCRGRNTIHTITEADVSEPRRLLGAHEAHTGEKLSLTAYIVACLAETLADFPEFNSFRKGGKLILLDELTIGVMVERTIEGEHIPEPVGIRAVNRKTFRQVNDEIRSAQAAVDRRLGGLSNATWVRFIPSFLFRSFVRAASRSITMSKRYGVIAVTAVGMFGEGPMWLVPLSAATVAVAVGAIVRRPVLLEKVVEVREHLCLTLAFDHDIVDGAPAARFTSRFREVLASADLLREALVPDVG